MSRFKHWALAAGLSAAVAAILPQQIEAQRSAVEIWSATCGRCHTIQPPNRYSAKDWASIGTHMAITARLTEAETEAVLGFLMSGARTLAAIDASLNHVVVVSSWGGLLVQPEKVYAEQCAACHGAGAKGDGPAAAAFNPKPTDMSVSEFWLERSDEQVDSVIAGGKGAMPPLGQALDRETRAELIRYLREKYGGGASFVRKTDGSGR